jgi:ribonuclease P/MRP protein subunit POP1
MAMTRDGENGNDPPNTPGEKTKSLKRKQPSGKQSEKNPSNTRQRKRARILDARGIATQTSDKALKSGKLDVNAFVQAREFEIRALEEGMAKARYAHRSCWRMDGCSLIDL